MLLFVVCWLGFVYYWKPHLVPHIGQAMCLLPRHIPSPSSVFVCFFVAAFTFYDSQSYKFFEETFPVQSQTYVDYMLRQNVCCDLMKFICFFLALIRRGITQDHYESPSHCTSDAVWFTQSVFTQYVCLISHTYERRRVGVRNVGSLTVCWPSIYLTVGVLDIKFPWSLSKREGQWVQPTSGQ